jgi:small subunit ribosomal protein S17
MNKRRRMKGFVTSDKMMKTVVVEVSRTFRHPLYKKVVHKKKRVYAHDELGSKIGDQVRIVESQPISRRKRWVVEEIIRSSEDLIAPRMEDEIVDDLAEEAA